MVSGMFSLQDSSYNVIFDFMLLFANFLQAKRKITAPFLM